jgi:ParB family chromosome partitioning protein
MNKFVEGEIMAEDGMKNEIRVTCHTSEHCGIDKLEPLQGTLKKRTQKDLDQIETSILKFGMAFPFFYSEIGGRYYILDGHGRKQALLRMRERGAVLPEMPVVRVEAASIEEAKQLLLRCESRYGLIDELGFDDFINGLDIDFGELNLGFDFGGDSREKTEKDLEKEKKVPSVRVGNYTVKMTEKEHEELKSRLVEYMSDNLVPEGFIASLLGIENEAGRGIFFLKRSIKELVPAEYNPRHCGDEKIESLKESIQQLGMLRPIIVNGKNKTIIAGHQRVRALKSLGENTAPVFITQAVGREQEVRINQIHNAIEDEDRTPCKIQESDAAGFCYVRTGIKQVRTIKALNYIDIILRCGNIDSAIALQDGTVLKGRDYLYACKMLHIPARVFYINSALKQAALKMLFIKYGEFNYEGKDDFSFQQRKAQMVRLGKNANKTNNVSQLYMMLFDHEDLAGKSILDFGAGRCAYAEKLAAKGIDILPIEFFRLGKNGKIDYEWTLTQIEKLAQKIRSGALFDIVICDSVLNSVVNAQAERDVLRCAASLLAKDGTAYVSGRCVERAKQKYSTRNTIYEMDKNNFTMNMRAGEWYAQHFHTKDDIKRIMGDNYFDILTLEYDNNTWRTRLKKSGLYSFGSCEESIKREFDLRYNKRDSYNKGAYILEALKCAYF